MSTRVREEGSYYGGSKLVTSLVLTLAALVALQSCGTEREFPGGSGGSAGSAVTANDAGETSHAGRANSGGDGAAGQACEPGLVELCYESPEGESYGELPEKAAGSCKIGMRICGTSSVWGSCMGAVAPAPADTCAPGNDDNCNGVPNEDCACEAGEMRACGTDEGECQQGQQACAEDLRWGPCEGEIIAEATDTCDEGNDANCDGAANTGCECINGTSRDCGSNTGNCSTGTQTCVNGVWSAECVGEVGPKTKDACDPKGDDADCDGVPNEDCACTAGDTQPCGNCGTLSCQSDGTWSTECEGSGVCSPGDVDTDSVACGNCGSQSRRRTCDDECSYGGWTNVGSCLGSGPCKVGDADETRSVACGNCSSGQQQQKRSCTAQCSWPAAWTNVGSCTGQGCAPGAVRAEASVSCGYCNGTQERESSCSQSCTWSQPTNKGACQQASCSSFPGDERVGYVSCFNDWPDFQAAVCTSAQDCCRTPNGGYSCKASCGASDALVPCDGPEDCGGSACCIQFDVATQTSHATCGGSCDQGRRCHTNDDCTTAMPFCRKSYSSASGAYNGRCGGSP